MGEDRIGLQHGCRTRKSSKSLRQYGLVVSHTLVHRLNGVVMETSDGAGKPQAFLMCIAPSEIGTCDSEIFFIISALN